MPTPPHSPATSGRPWISPPCVARQFAAGLDRPDDRAGQPDRIPDVPIVLTYVQMNDEGDAQKAYGILQNQYPSGSIGHAYARMAQAFWEHTVEPACGPGLSAAAARSPRHTPTKSSLRCTSDTPTACWRPPICARPNLPEALQNRAGAVRGADRANGWPLLPLATSPLRRRTAGGARPEAERLSRVSTVSRGKRAPASGPRRHPSTPSGAGS